MKIFMDGDSWCAVEDDFIDLQISPAGFGDTEQEAISNLIEELKKEGNTYNKMEKP